MLVIRAVPHVTFFGGDNGTPPNAGGVDLHVFISLFSGAFWERTHGPCRAVHDCCSMRFDIAASEARD